MDMIKTSSRCLEKHKSKTLSLSFRIQVTNRKLRILIKNKTKKNLAD